MDLRDIRRPNRNIFVCNSNAEARRIAGFKDPVQEVKCTTGAVSVPPTTTVQFVPSSVETARPMRPSARVSIDASLVQKQSQPL